MGRKTKMSNIHADLIKNATDMQSQLLEFSHQLSNLSLKSLDDQNKFKMTEAPVFNSETATEGIGASGDLTSDSGFISVKVADTSDSSKTVTVVFKISGKISPVGDKYNLSSYIDSNAFSGITSDIILTEVPAANIKIKVIPSNAITVTFKLNENTMSVNIPSTGIPEGASGSSDQDQQSAAQSMAVVAMNLRGVGVPPADILEIFKNGITPTSLAAVESQLKGHHDAVLQLSLESLSRVTNILQKIAQKLGS
jgi:hypothetical protein